MKIKQWARLKTIILNTILTPFYNSLYIPFYLSLIGSSNENTILEAASSDLELKFWIELWLHLWLIDWDPEIPLRCSALVESIFPATFPVIKRVSRKQGIITKQAFLRYPETGAILKNNMWNLISRHTIGSRWCDILSKRVALV